MKCLICGRKAESGLCKLHEEAHKNLLKNYDLWKKSLGMSWIGYLKEVQRNPFAGVWAKEVAQHLLASDSAKNQDNSESGMRVGG